MKPLSIVKHGRLPALLAVVLVMSLGFTVVLASEPALTPSALVFQSPPPIPPANDNFANATAIASLPFVQTVDAVAATLEPGEPQYCSGSSQTIWYKLTLDHSTWVRVGHWGTSSSNLTVYRSSGPGFDGLSYMMCGPYDSYLTFQAEAGATYYFQQTPMYGGGSLTIDVQVLVPNAQFAFYPGDPSIFDNIQFYDYSWDPAGIQSQAWSFGDGATAQGCCPTHRYSKDGNYTVKLTVTTPDGRTGSIVQTVRVTTHDVAISKIDAPQAAQAGQTRQIGVNIKNTRYPETVGVELYKSVPGGFQRIASTEQNIPVRSGNRTTAVGLSYTFTDADAAVGKVTFKAVVYIINIRDALPADNEAIASPTKVSR